jgi:hypothetical protein
MWDALAGFFQHLVAANNPVWFYYPLAAVVAVVYKATKYDCPVRIARAAAHFFATVSLGMLGLALAFYVIARFF